MKRTGAWVLTGLLVILGGVIAFFAYNGTSRKFEFTTEEVQSRINAALDKRATDEKSVNVESATVIFAHDKVIIDATANGKIKNRQLRADVHAVGRPEYRGGSFYFFPTERPVFSNMKLEKIEPAKQGLFGKTEEKLKERLGKVVAEHGWEEVLETFKADLQMWTIHVAEKGVETALTKRPIYTPKNDLKGYVIKAAVEKVEVVGDTLVVTVSLTQILYTIFVTVLLAVIAIGIVIFLILNPEFGLAVALVGSIGS